MPAFTLRPATSDDARAIRALIRNVGINPMGLNWQRFVVAAAPQDGLIGCGQVKKHQYRVAAPVREMASIAVVPDWRGEGVASAIIDYLLAAHTPPLYLTCRASLVPFYERFGFRVITETEMPSYFRRIHKIAKVFRAIRLLREDVLVMRRDK